MTWTVHFKTEGMPYDEAFQFNDEDRARSFESFLGQHQRYVDVSVLEEAATNWVEYTKDKAGSWGEFGAERYFYRWRNR